MRFQLTEHLQQMGLANEIFVKFIYLPAYSPKFNLVTESSNGKVVGLPEKPSPTSGKRQEILSRF